MSQRLRHERAEAAQNRSTWKLAGIIVGSIVATVFAVGLIGLALILHTTPPPVIHTDPAAAQRLQQEIQLAQTAATNGKPGVVSADETELNSILKEYVKAAADQRPAKSDAVLRDMKMNLAEDRLRLYALVNLRGKDLTFVLEGKVRSTDGFLDFEPVSAKIGSLSMPRTSLKRAMEQMIATPETQELMRLPRNLRDLRVENGKLILVFQ